MVIKFPGSRWERNEDCINVWQRLSESGTKKTTYLQLLLRTHVDITFCFHLVQRYSKTETNTHPARRS